MFLISKYQITGPSVYFIRLRGIIGRKEVKFHTNKQQHNPTCQVSVYLQRRRPSSITGAVDLLVWRF